VNVVKLAPSGVHGRYAFDDDRPICLNFSGLTAGLKKLKGRKATETARGKPTHCGHEFIVADEIEGE
jgi:hypothetical protein